MSAGRRHHGPKMWAWDRGDAVRWAVRTLARAFGDEGHPEIGVTQPGKAPEMETGSERRTKMVHRRSAEETLPGVTRAGLLATALLRGRAGRQLAAATPRAAPWQLEGLPDAPERPARRGGQGAPLAPARVVE